MRASRRGLFYLEGGNPPHLPGLYLESGRLTSNRPRNAASTSSDFGKAISYRAVACSVVNGCARNSRRRDCSKYRMKYAELMVETEINFIDPAVKYADQAKAWRFKRVGTLDGLTIVRTAIPDQIADGVQEFFAMNGKRAVAVVFLAPWMQPEGKRVRYAAVTPDYRSKGIVRRLYLWLLASAGERQ